MKTTLNVAISLSIMLVICNSAVAQVPGGLTYQAVIRNVENDLVVNQMVGIRISILVDNVDGESVYTEVHQINSNQNGLISLVIGYGETEDDFLSIPWEVGIYFLKTEIDPNGEDNYSIIGVNQLLSVPYAFHSLTADSLTGVLDETDPVFLESVSSAISEQDTANWNNMLSAENQSFADVLNVSNDAASNRLINVSNPIENQDAATKIYADNIRNSIMEDLLNAGLNGVVGDVDGNFYPTVKIGNQVWMAENLRTTRFNDATPIVNITDNTEWMNLSTPSYCWYNNDSTTYNDPYGKLYNWFAVEDDNLCPEGWHVPTSDDYYELLDFLGASGGGKLKKEGILYWLTPNAGATNITGYSAVGSGWRYDDGSFAYINHTTSFFTTTECEPTKALALYLNYNMVDAYVFGSGYFKTFGLPIRCIRN